MKKLQITLKKQWFDMIASGEKKKEYREIKWYWIIRLFIQEEGSKLMLRQFMKALMSGEDMEVAQYRFRVKQKYFRRILATNGYSGCSPSMYWDHVSTTIETPTIGWCDPEDKGKRLITLKIGSVRITRK